MMSDLEPEQPAPPPADQQVSPGDAGVPPAPASGAASPREAGGGGTIAARIAGLSTMKGLVLYGATLTFAGFYAYFMDRIAAAPAGKAPTFNTAMVAAAAALAGILGSAFALVIGSPTTATNEALQKELKLQKTLKSRNGAEPADEPAKQPKKGLWIWKLLSLEPGGSDRASYPLTFGIWMYAVVAGAVAIIYFLNPSETPDSIKALATAFAGYVVALMTAAYGIATKAPSGGSG